MTRLPGHLLLGAVTGLITGMSTSPVVGVALPLIFAFAGGSVVALSVRAGMTPEKYTLPDEQLTWFSSGILLGLAVGIFLRCVHFTLPAQAG